MNHPGMTHPLRAFRRFADPTTARATGLGAIWLLTAPLVLQAQEDGGSGIFSLNAGLVVWTWVLFLFTLAILAWKVFPAISGGLEERHAKIQGAIDDARKAREDAEALLAKQQAAVDEARRESQEMLDKARGAADGLKKEILEEARAQQSAMLDDARREIDLERDKLREDIRREAVDIALAASERLMRTQLDAEENRRLVHEFVSEL